jgi:maltooligosyltrehalose trehalohydrolase
MLEWYHDLISLRRKESALATGRLADVGVSYDEDEQWFCLARGDLRVVCNLGDTAQQVPIDAEPLDAVAVWDPATTTLHESTVELGPHCVAVVRVVAAH